MDDQQHDQQAAVQQRAVMQFTGWINRADGTKEPITVTSQEVPLELAQKLCLPKEA